MGSKVFKYNAERLEISRIFYNCIERKCTREQLQDFINREKRRWEGNEEIILLLKHLESEIREEEVA